MSLFILFVSSLVCFFSFFGFQKVKFTKFYHKYGRQKMKELCNCIIFTHAGSKQNDSKVRQSIIVMVPYDMLEKKYSSLVVCNYSAYSWVMTQLVNISKVYIYYTSHLDFSSFHFFGQLLGFFLALASFWFTNFSL